MLVGYVSIPLQKFHTFEPENWHLNIIIFSPGNVCSFIRDNIGLVVTFGTVLTVSSDVTRNPKIFPET